MCKFHKTKAYAEIVSYQKEFGLTDYWKREVVKRAKSNALKCEAVLWTNLGLGGLFFWAQTAEGHMFWRNIHYRLSGSEILPKGKPNVL